jgi:hypothetical protein
VLLAFRANFPMSKLSNLFRLQTAPLRGKSQTLRRERNSLLYARNFVVDEGRFQELRLILRSGSTRFHPNRRASTDHRPGPNMATAQPMVPSKTVTHRSPAIVMICQVSSNATKVPTMGVHELPSRQPQIDPTDSQRGTPGSDSDGDRSLYGGRCSARNHNGSDVGGQRARMYASMVRAYRQRVAANGSRATRARQHRLHSSSESFLVVTKACRKSEGLILGDRS